MIRWLLLAAGLVGVRVRAQAPQVDVALVPEMVSLQPSATFRVGVQLRIPQGWHLYWTNPGQSGLPLTLDWRLPTGVDHRATAWPVPDREDSAGIVSHTYRGEIALVSELRIAPTATVGSVSLVASLAWGICREICIPQERDVSISLPVGSLPAQASPRWKAFYVAAAAHLPVVPERLRLSAVEGRSGLRLTIRRPDQTSFAAGSATFFPDRRGAAAVVVSALAVTRGLMFALPTEVADGSHPPRLRGVLVLDQGQALLLDLAVERAAHDPLTPAGASRRSPDR